MWMILRIDGGEALGIMGYFEISSSEELFNINFVPSLSCPLDLKTFRHVRTSIIVGAWSRIFFIILQ